MSPSPSESERLVSTCCEADVQQSSGADFHSYEDDPIGYGTQFYLCRRCGQPCDVEGDAE